VVWRDFVVKEALLFLGAARDLCAQALNGGYGLFKGPAGLNWLVEYAISSARSSADFPEDFATIYSCGNDGRALGEL
jgi:hypothetical protein